MCTVLFDRFKDLDACFEAGKSVFEEEFTFDIRNPQPVAGVGCFSTKNIFRKGMTCYVGEAAGLQDLMWGFGIRTAVQSGKLAADCIIQGRDYEKEARTYFESRLKATLTGRFLWEMARARDYSLIVSQGFKNGANRGFNLSFLYNFGALQKLIYPIAVSTMRRRYPNLRI